MSPVCGLCRSPVGRAQIKSSYLFPTCFYLTFQISLETDVVSMTPRHLLLPQHTQAKERWRHQNSHASINRNHTGTCAAAWYHHCRLQIPFSENRPSSHGRRPSQKHCDCSNPPQGTLADGTHTAVDGWTTSGLVHASPMQAVLPRTPQGCGDSLLALSMHIISGKVA